MSSLSEAGTVFFKQHFTVGNRFFLIFCLVSVALTVTLNRLLKSVDKQVKNLDQLSKQIT